MDILSPRDSLFDDLREEHAAVDPVEIETRRSQPEREPIYSVETLMDGRSVWAAVFENARPFVRD